MSTFAWVTLIGIVLGFWGGPILYVAAFLVYAIVILIAIVISTLFGIGKILLKGIHYED